MASEESGAHMQALVFSSKQCKEGVLRQKAMCRACLAKQFQLAASQGSRIMLDSTANTPHCRSGSGR